MKNKNRFGGLFLDSEPLPTERIFDVLLNVLLIIAIFLFGMHLLFASVEVKGHSMDDTLYNGEYVAIGNFGSGCEVGDIVVVEKNDDADGEEDIMIIKRVTAVGGDKIAFAYDDGIISFYRNDFTRPVAEEYIKEPMANIGKFSAVPVAPSPEQISGYIVEIPADEIFVMGDNRNASTDSRATGPVNKSAVKGKMVFAISGNVFWETVFGIK